MIARIRRFYLVAIWMPLIVPICFATGFWARGGGKFEGFGADVGGILVLSLLAAGVPVAIFALWVTRWLCASGRTEKGVRRLMWASPLIVAAFAMPYWIVTQGIQYGFTAVLVEGISVTYLPWLLGLGYLYVLATAGTRWVLSPSLRSVEETVNDALQSTRGEKLEARISDPGQLR
jgi:hypothetical protein